MTSKNIYQEKPKITRKNIYDLFIATRPLSLTLALYSTTLGIVIAYSQGFIFSQYSFKMDMVKIILVTIAGLFIQTGTNLINDYFECEYKYRHQSIKKYRFLGKMRTQFDILIFLLGLACFGVSGLIGLYLMYITSTKLIIIGVLGIIGGYSYTGQPIVYKKRGLGTPLSFILMGPLMVYGSYVVFSQSFSWTPLLLSLPVSLLIPALMLSNELRDYDRDKGLGIRTMTVRFGYDFGRNLYIGLLISSYLLVLMFITLNMMPLISLIVLATIPLALKSYRLVAVDKRALVPETNRLHLTFGLIVILSIVINL